MKVSKMKYDRTYYKDIDIIRIIACMAILLYHLNIIKGGYLAVCSFFVLSGYLACARAFKKKDDFSIKQYYIKQIKRVYIPLLVVVMVTVGVICPSYRFTFYASLVYRDYITV